MPALIDMSGQTFGRLTVIGRAENADKPCGKHDVQWTCRCECGAETTVRACHLRSGATKSCGCGVTRPVGTPFKSQPVVKYEGAHARVRRDRGKAKHHGCVDCGEQAVDWSYDGTDPNEQTETRSNRGTTVEVAYSLKPEHYSPRCRSCHIKFDKAGKR